MQLQAQPSLDRTPWHPDVDLGANGSESSRDKFRGKETGSEPLVKTPEGDTMKSHQPELEQMTRFTHVAGRRSGALLMWHRTGVCGCWPELKPEVVSLCVVMDSICTAFFVIISPLLRGSMVSEESPKP